MTNSCNKTQNNLFACLIYQNAFEFQVYVTFTSLIQVNMNKTKITQKENRYHRKNTQTN